MANALQIDLNDRWVMARGKIFKCKGGFGCSPTTNGAKIFGYFTEDINGEEPDKSEMTCITGYEVTELIK